jgi:hypothetical protein
LLADLVLVVLKRTVEELETEIQLLATGRRAIFDVREGKIVDTSQETLSQKRVYRDRLSEFISKLEADDIPRP